MGNFPDSAEQRDLVLGPGFYAHMQDETKGIVRTNVGPILVSQTGQNQPVRYDHKTREFQRVSLEQAKVPTTLANENDYIVLENPAKNGEHPKPSTCENDMELLAGCKINIPGPAQFALWPGQHATVIPGHRLRRNDYLLVRIYNEEKARENWESALKTVVVEELDQPKQPTPQPSEEPNANLPSGDVPKPTAVVTKTAEELDLTTGKLLIIKGTEVSWYLPPTGVEVVPTSDGKYIRDAVTLEQLEYAILIDQNGRKRYEKGPQVVFPEPTEEFFKENGNRKFRAIELNKISGIHVKVIAPWTDESGEKHDEGTELFITGGEQAIFYPCPELSIIKYGDKTKHYATAIPDAGSGRYVMNRETGVVKTEKGPQMLLPDPRTEVIVRRILDERQVGLWYPGNAEAQAYNEQLRRLTIGGTGEGGRVDEMSYQSMAAPPARRGRRGKMRSAGLECMATMDAAEAIDDVYEAEAAGSGEFADAFTRNTQYTPPRTITVDDKYDGVPRIGIWTGFAVMVVKKTGERKVEIGPKTILLDYDQNLEVLELSTGKPKNTDTLYKTVYLRITNNKVSDIIDLETSDQIPISVKISMVVNFEGDEEKWFDSENYVKLLCDHVRSMLKGRVRKEGIREFDKNHVELIRNTILGESIAAEDGTTSRKGLSFEENGMRVCDVEVLDFKIEDEHIARMLKDAQHETITSNISLDQAEKDLEVTRRSEQIAQEKDVAKAMTAEKRTELAVKEVEQQLELTMSRLASEQNSTEEKKKLALAQEAVEDAKHDSDLARRERSWTQRNDQAKEELRQLIEKLKEETSAVVEKFGAAQSGFSESLLALQNAELMEKVVQAGSVQAMIGGESIVDVLKKILTGTPLEDVADKIIQRGRQSIPSPDRV